MDNVTENSIKGKVISGLFWKFFERIAAQSVSLIVSIILARLVLPEDYGAISLVTIFITLANVFVSDGFGVALIQKKDADIIDFSTVFYFGLFFSIILYIIMFLVSPLVANFYNMPILTTVLRVLSLKIPIASINSVQHSYVSRKMIFKKFFFSTLVGTIISAIIGIIMAYYGFGVWALVCQYMSNSIIDTVVLWFTVKWRPKRVFSFVRLKALFSYGWKLLLQSFGVKLYANLRSLVIGKVYSSSDLAFYNKGNQFPNLIVTNVDTAINSTLFPALSKKQNNLDKVKSITRKATQLSSYIMSPLLIGFAACANTFVELVLTKKWLPIVPYLVILCLTLLCRPAQTSTLQAIKATGRSDAVLKMDIPIRVFGLLTLIISVRFGIIYIAVSEFIAETTGWIIYAIVCDKIVGYKFIENFKDMFFNIISAIVMGAIVVIIDRFLVLPLIFKLSVDILTGILTYLSVSILTKNNNYYYILNEIKNYFFKLKNNKRRSVY